VTRVTSGCDCPGKASAGVKCLPVEIRSAIPYPLKVWWFSCAPIALPFAVRIAWEKTVWTWSRGPQMVGFSLMHIHPGLAAIGLLGSIGAMLWLLPAIPYYIVRRHAAGIVDVTMFACAAFVTLAVTIPDSFFA